MTVPGSRLPVPRARARTLAHAFARVRPGRRFALVAASGLVAMLAACSSSPPARFYTLGDGRQGAPAATSGTSARPALFIEVPPVDVPSQVAMNQLVVQTSPTRVRVLEDDRWAALPADEIRGALSADLTRRLGTLDVYGTGYPTGVPVYRVSVAVQRFESWPDSHALIDAVWSVRAVDSQAVLTCRTVADEPVSGSGYDALVDGHRRAVQQISARIAAGIRELGALPPTPAAGGGKAAKRTAPPAPPLVPCPSDDATVPAASN